MAAWTAETWIGGKAIGGRDYPASNSVCGKFVLGYVSAYFR
jgi:hypothetical protein